MNYSKTFYYVWKNSFSSAKYYKDIIKAPFSFSLKYFLFFCFLLSVITTVYLGVKIFNPLNNFLKRFPQVLIKVYPAELEVKIRRGVVSTNVQEPYFLPVDRLEKTFEDFNNDVKGLNSDKIENILVIDTRAKVEDMARFQTYALLTKNYLSFYNEDGRIEIIPLDEIKDFTVNQSVVRGLINRLLPLLGYISILLIPFIFTGSFLFFSIFQLIYLLFVAIFLFVAAKIISFPLSYLKSYQIDLHLSTIITPFFLLMSAVKIDVQFPFLKVIVFTLIGIYILNSLKGNVPKEVTVKKQSKRS